MVKDLYEETKTGPITVTEGDALVVFTHPNEESVLFSWHSGIPLEILLLMVSKPL